MMLFEFSCIFSWVFGLFCFYIFRFYLNVFRVIVGAENSKIFVKILSHFLTLFSLIAKRFSAHFLFQFLAQFTLIFSHKSLLIFTHNFSFYFSHNFSFMNSLSRSFSHTFSLLIFSLNLCSISHSFSRTFLY